MRSTDRELLKRAELTSDEIKRLYSQLDTLYGYERTGAIETLVGSPNCPPDIYAALFPLAPNQGLLNPAWPLFLLEGQFLHELDRTFIATCLRHGNTTSTFLEALTSHPVGWIASAARQHVALVGEASAGWGQELLTDFATRLWRDSSLVWVMRAGALPDAINRRLLYPMKTQPLLPERECQRVLEKIAGQRRTSLAAVLAIAHMQNPLQKWAEHPHWERRFALAINPTIQLMKKRLQHDGHVWVRAVARQHLADPGGRLF